MTPYYDDGQMQVWHGDCRDVLPLIKRESVSLVVTSPPYNIGKLYADYHDRADGYLDFVTDAINAASETIKGDGAVWVNTGYRTTERGNVPIAFEVQPRVSLYLMQHVVWEYGAGMTYASRFNHRSEDWLWFVSDPERYCFNGDAVRDRSLTVYRQDKRNNPKGKLPGTVWYFPHVAGTHSEREDHPAQFPETMIRRIVLACSNEGDVILDPFMGSGTTLRVAKDLGRRGIGIDVSKAYCAGVVRRLQQAVLQLDISA